MTSIISGKLRMAMLTALMNALVSASLSFWN